MKQSEFIAGVLVGNGQMDPKAGPVSWALQKKFESICRQFADALDQHEVGFDRDLFLRQCGTSEQDWL